MPGIAYVAILPGKQIRVYGDSWGDLETECKWNADLCRISR
jgi:hypothetical protein